MQKELWSLLGVHSELSDNGLESISHLVHLLNWIDSICHKLIHNKLAVTEMDQQKTIFRDFLILRHNLIREIPSEIKKSFAGDLRQKTSNVIGISNCIVAISQSP